MNFTYFHSKLFENLYIFKGGFIIRETVAMAPRIFFILRNKNMVDLQTFNVKTSLAELLNEKCPQKALRSFYLNYSKSIYHEHSKGVGNHFF